MADPVQQLMAKIGLDLSPLRDAATQIKATLGDLATSLKTSLGQATVEIGKQTDELLKVRQATSDIVNAALQGVAAEVQKTAVLKTSTAEYQSQAAAQRAIAEVSRTAVADEAAKSAAIQTETAEHQKLLAQRRAETAEIQKQIAEIRKKTLEEKAESSGERKKEGGSSVLGTLTGAVLGKGLVGSIAGGVLAGEGIQAAVEGLAHFIAKMKEMQDESSKVVLVTDRFNALAQGVGVDGVEMMDKLRESTEGLVDRLTLAQFGTRALQANIKGFTPEKIVELTGAVVKLAESAGRMNATQAVEQLGAAISRGGQRAAFTIAQITGLTRQQLVLANLSPILNRNERDALSLAHALAVVTAEAAKLGETPRTLAQAATQLEVLSKDLVLSFGKGFTESASTQTVLKFVSEFASNVHGLESTVEQLGSRLGDGFLVVSVAAKSASATVKELWNTIADTLHVAADSTGFSQLFSTAKAEATEAETTFKAMNPTLYGILETIVNVNLQIQLWLLGLRDIFKEIARFLPDAAALASAVAGARAGGALGAELGGPEGAAAGATIGGVAALAGGHAIGAYKTDQDNPERQHQRQYQRDFEALKGVLKSLTEWGKGDRTKKQVKLPDSFTPTATVPNNFVGPLATDQSRQPLSEADQLKQNAKQLLAGIAEEQVKAAKSAKSIAPPETEETDRRAQNDAIEARAKFYDELARLRDAANKNELDVAKAQITRERELDQNRYEDGEEQLATHLAKQKELAGKDRDTRLSEIEQNLQAELQKQASVRDKANSLEKIGQITPQKALEERNSASFGEAEAQTKAQGERVKAESDYQHALYTIDRQGAKDTQAARRVEISESLQMEQEAAKQKLKIAEEANKRQKQSLDRQLQQGQISPGDYFQKQIQGLEELTRAQVAHEQEVAAAKREAAGADYLAGPQNAKTGAEYTKSYTAAGTQATDAITEITQKASDELQAYFDKLPQQLLTALNKPYQQRQQATQEQIQYTGAEPNNESKLLQLNEQLKASYEAQRLQLEVLSKTLKPYSDEWYSVYSEIEKTYQGELKVNQELERMRDLMQPIASGFETIGKGIQENFGSKFAQNLAGLVQSGSASIKQSTQLGQTIGGIKVDQPKSPQQLALEKAATGIFDKAKGSSSTAAAMLDTFTAAVDAATKRINQLGGGSGVVTVGAAQGAEQPESIDTSNPSQTTEASTVPGINDPSLQGGQGIGGAPSSFSSTLSSLATKFGAAVTAVDGFTKSILSAKSAVGGAAGGAAGGAGLGNTISQALGFAGPLGSILGGVGGAALGAITGSKNAGVTSNINSLNTQYQSLMNQFQINTNNLNNTLTSMQALMAEAQALQASSKKGSAQYQQVINQYISQIEQLQDQQHQLIVQMQQQLAIATAPLGQQSLLTNLQQIINQYEQFAGAASTTEQLAQATQLLAASLQNYDTQVATQYNQNQQQAINDALQLNDLLYQRTQYMQQINDQIESVLNQGVLTRMPTRAQTAGEQIEQIQANAQIQLDQMNEQISASTFQVQAAQQIYNLAQTRIGLENQLLTAQNQQTQLQMAQVAQLATFYQAMVSGNFSSIPNITQLLNAIPGSTTPGGTAPASADQILQMLFAGTYNAYSGLGLGTYNGANL